MSKKENLDDLKDQERCVCEGAGEECQCQHEHKESKKEKKNELEHLKLKVEELEIENAKLKNEFLKAYADTENMKKRLQQDFEMSMKYRIQSFALDILPVIDNLERALAIQGNEQDSSYRKGVEMIYAQLIQALNKEGVEEVKAAGEAFDANFHQALMSEAIDGVEANQVTEVLQKGYKLKDRILRAAMVKVSE